MNIFMFKQEAGNVFFGLYLFLQISASFIKIKIINTVGCVINIKFLIRIGIRYIRYVLSNISPDYIYIGFG